MTNDPENTREIEEQVIDSEPVMDESSEVVESTADEVSEEQEAMDESSEVVESTADEVSEEQEAMDEESAAKIRADEEDSVDDIEVEVNVDAEVATSDETPALYRILGEIAIFDASGSVQGYYQQGQEVEFPTSIGDIYVEDGRAEKVEVE